MRTARFLIITGLSGSGKSQAIKALEDIGYFCVDNLPTTLIPTFAELCMRPGSELSQVALGVDVREGGFLSQFPRAFARLRALRGVKASLLFLEANDATLVRRFSETRRPHPLGGNRPVLEGIRIERRRLAPVRKLADEIIDSSDLSVHQLRQVVLDAVRERTRASRMVLTVVSFGYKYGIPFDADLLFDARFLPNPHFVPGLRAKTGRDGAVRRYMLSFAVTREFLDSLSGFLAYLIPQYIAEGKSYLTIGIGCTGGRHRAPMIAEALRTRLAKGTHGVVIQVRHRDVIRK